MCSCTDEPSWADECMRKFEVGNGMTLKEVAQSDCDVDKNDALLCPLN